MKFSLVLNRDYKCSDFFLVAFQLQGTLFQTLRIQIGSFDGELTDQDLSRASQRCQSCSSIGHIT